MNSSFCIRFSDQLAPTSRGEPPDGAPKPEASGTVYAVCARMRALRVARKSVDRYASSRRDWQRTLPRRRCSIADGNAGRTEDEVRCRERLGGVLKFHHAAISSLVAPDIGRRSAGDVSTH